MNMAKYLLPLNSSAKFKKDRGYSFKSFKVCESIENPTQINAFGINYITHQLLIGTDVIFKLYSTITNKKLDKQVDFYKKLLIAYNTKMTVTDIEALILVNC